MNPDLLTNLTSPCVIVLFFQLDQCLNLNIDFSSSVVSIRTQTSLEFGYILFLSSVLICRCLLDMNAFDKDSDSRFVYKTFVGKL